MVLWSWSWWALGHARNRNEVHGTSKIFTALRVVLGPGLYIWVGISAVRIVHVGRTRLLGKGLFGLRAGAWDLHMAVELELNAGLVQAVALAVGFVQVVVLEPTVPVE